MNSLDRLTDLLAQRNMSLFSLAKESGIHYSTFDAAKRRSGQLSIDTIERVCDYLQIPLYRPEKIINVQFLGYILMLSQIAGGQNLIGIEKCQRGMKYGSF